MIHTVKGSSIVSETEVDVFLEFPCFLYGPAAKSLQCLTLWDPTDGSPPGSPVPGILQARTLEWVAISFSNAWKWKAKVKSLSPIWLLATPWTAAYQAPPSMGFSRQEYWSGVPLPSLMVQQMLAISFLVPLPFLNPAWISGSSWFTYCWSLAWRTLSITLLAWEMRAIVQWFDNSLVMLFLGIGMRIDLCQSCGLC